MEADSSRGLSSARVKRGDKCTGIHRSSRFKLGAGDVTFDYAGAGGYVAVCRGNECVRGGEAGRKTVSFGKGTIHASKLAHWVGKDVELQIVDQSARGWGFIAVSNIAYHGVPSSPAVSSKSS